MPLLPKLPSFKKERSLQQDKLDESDLRLLKEVANFFLSVDFHGSELEALLTGRGVYYPSRCSACSSLICRSEIS